MAKGVGLRLLSRRGSWLQIPPSAPTLSPSLFETVLVMDSLAKALLASLKLAGYPSPVS